MISLTEGDTGGPKRIREDDGFKTSLSKATFIYNLTPFCVCWDDFIFDSCCLVVSSARRRGRLAALSISAVSYLGVCEMWLLGVDVEGVKQ